MNWKECTLGELITLQRGKDLPVSEIVQGNYPVMGSSGIIGWHNMYTTAAPTITVGRSGNSVGKVNFYSGCAWAHNTTLYVKQFNNCDPTFIYYLLKTLDLGHYAGGSAVPTLNRNHIHTLNVRIPVQIREQQAIAHILRSLEHKIDCNSKINDNLAA